MAEIPSLFMIIVGIVVAGVSYYAGDNFRLFFYAGIAFFVYGLLKWLILRGRYRPEKAEAKRIYSASLQKQKQKYAYCKHCGSVVHYNDNFCYKCGQRLR